jgi:hypothetical protein
MSLSSDPDRLETVARQIGERLPCAKAFQQKGCAFHRVIEPGFVHIIEFGLGPHGPCFTISLRWMYWFL